MPKALTRRVVFQPDTYEGLQRGINLMADIVRPTLGPYPRTVAIERMTNSKSAELLDDGGTITRRIIQFADRDADMGAMLVRHLLWRIQEQVGDGTATAATIFQAVYNQGMRYIQAGGNALQLRRHLEQGAQVVVKQLDDRTLRVAGKARLTELAESICHDRPLALMLGEIFDIVGEHGHVDIRRGQGRTIDRHYVEGMFWASSPFSAHMFNDQRTLRLDVQNTALLITDLDLAEPAALIPILDLAKESNIRSLIVLAAEMSERVIATVLQASQEPDTLQVVAVKTPGLGTLEQSEAMDDLAILTGGHVFRQAAGDTLRRMTVDDLGYARKAWVDRSYFGVVGGKGDPRELRRHIANVRGLLERTKDEHVRARLQERVGKLMGGSATLLLGNTTDAENEVQDALARRTTAALRAALRDGVVLGSGRSLLACQDELKRLIQVSGDEHERAACRILVVALEEPLRTIAANAGYDPSAVVADVAHAPAGSGFDVRSGTVVDLTAAGIFDVAAAQKAAVYSAVTAAAHALTIDVLIHSKQPQYAAMT